MSDFTVRRVPEAEGAEQDRQAEADRRKGREDLRDLTTNDVKVIVADLRAGRLKRLEGVRLPVDLNEPTCLTLSGVEFTNVDAPSLWHGTKRQPAVLTDCAFVDTRLEPWDSWHTTYRGCTFDRVRTGTTGYLGAVGESTFVSSTFTDCRLSHLGFFGTTFTDVDFRRLRGSRLRWEECTFERVTVSGHLGVVHWIDCGFEDVDLTRVHLPDATIMGARRNRVALPEFRDGFFVRQHDVHAGLVAVREHVGSATRRRLDDFLVGPAEQSVGPELELINEDLVRVMVEATAEEAVTIVDQLYPHRVRVPDSVEPNPRRRPRWPGWRGGNER